eukprot:6056419-Pleurochrysis_carterae.AAC.5
MRQALKPDDSQKLKFWVGEVKVKLTEKREKLSEVLNDCAPCEPDTLSDCAGLRAVPFALYLFSLTSLRKSFSVETHTCINTNLHVSYLFCVWVFKLCGVIEAIIS